MCSISTLDFGDFHFANGVVRPIRKRVLADYFDLNGTAGFIGFSVIAFGKGVDFQVIDEGQNVVALSP